MNNLLKWAPRLALRLARADMVFWLMPVLMILLIAGTLAQKWIGLYAAHQLFFSSFVLWAGPVPLPGGYTVLGVLTLNLAFKFLFASEWNWNKAGIILSHLGVLILLVGGLLTALTAKEHYMILAEGQESPYVYDYVRRELAIYKNEDSVLKIPFEIVKNDRPSLPFTLEVLRTYKNSHIVKREEMAEEFDQRTLHGMAMHMALQDKPAERDPEANISGLVFAVRGLDEAQDGIYIAIEGMPAPITLRYKDNEYHVILGKAQTRLPFSLKLKNFIKESYPGTNKARAYSSDIIVQDGALEWPAIVEMNKPLRYKGYTFFQSSFERDTLGTERSIFAVVKNQGRLLPYIGTIILAAGLLLHILTILKRRNA